MLPRKKADILIVDDTPANLRAVLDSPRYEVKEARDVPIIFVTATYQEDPAIRRGFEVGDIDYFGKPFDPEILKLKVGIYIDLYLKTKRLEETEELLKTHDQIKTLLEAMPVGVIISDASSLVYECNEEARRIWGGTCDWKLSDCRPFKGWWEDSGKPLGEVSILQDVTLHKELADDIELRARQLLRDVKDLSSHRSHV